LIKDLKALEDDILSPEEILLLSNVLSPPTIAEFHLEDKESCLRNLRSSTGSNESSYRPSAETTKGRCRSVAVTATLLNQKRDKCQLNPIRSVVPGVEFLNLLTSSVEAGNENDTLDWRIYDLYLYEPYQMELLKQLIVAGGGLDLVKPVIQHYLTERRLLTDLIDHDEAEREILINNMSPSEVFCVLNGCSTAGTRRALTKLLNPQQFELLILCHIMVMFKLSALEARRKRAPLTSMYSKTNSGRIRRSGKSVLGSIFCPALKSKDSCGAEMTAELSHNLELFRSLGLLQHEYPKSSPMFIAESLSHKGVLPKVKEALAYVSNINDTDMKIHLFTDHIKYNFSPVERDPTILMSTPDRVEPLTPVSNRNEVTETDQTAEKVSRRSQNIEQILDDLKYAIKFFHQSDPSHYTLSVVWVPGDNRTEESYQPKDWLSYTMESLSELLGTQVPVESITSMRSIGSFRLSTSQHIEMV